MNALFALLCTPALLAQPPALPPSLAFLAEERTAAMIVFGAHGHPLTRSVRATTRAPELAPLELGFRVMDPDRKEWAERISVLRGLAPLPSSGGWLLLSPAGKVLASGANAPEPSRLATILDEAGIQPPLVKVKAFLRSHPDHLEARQTLLRLLRKGAVARTRRILQIEAKSLVERSQDGEIQSWAYNAIDIPDMGSYRDKRLEPTRDLEIWGAYAQEVDRVFTDGSWPGLDLGMRPDADLPLEVCSPTMQAMYLKHLPKVETLLASLPGTQQLWGLWLRMTAISGKPKQGAFAAGLPVPPPELGIEWPPEAVVRVLVKDAQTRGDWSLVRELLDSFWKKVQQNTASEKNRTPGPSQRVASNPNWETGYGPLLEAMLRMETEGEAQELVEGLALDPDKRAFVDRAIALANACQRPTLARRWASLGR